MKSPHGQLNKQDWKKLKDDALYFLLIPVIFYVTAILGVIQQEGHVLSVQDFIPTNATLVAIAVYVLNTILNGLRKYVKGK